MQTTSLREEGLHGTIGDFELGDAIKQVNLKPEMVTYQVGQTETTH